MTFTGDNYHFTLHDMSAHDKPKGYSVDYINPARMTIPQTDFKLGYFIRDHYSVAVGWDHMKYVMYQNRTIDLDGYYPNTGTYGELDPNNPGKVVLTRDFLTYEHTDGLNYINAEVARHDDFSHLLFHGNTDRVQFNLIDGFGAGVLFPKTNTKLLGQDRHDAFHVSGYGLSVKEALNITFFKYFYIQGELKGGYINMPDIRTTRFTADRASQDFFFFERIVAVGGVFRI